VRYVPYLLLRLVRPAGAGPCLALVARERPWLRARGGHVGQCVIDVWTKRDMLPNLRYLLDQWDPIGGRRRGARRVRLPDGVAVEEADRW